MSSEVVQPRTSQGAASKPASVLMTLNMPSWTFAYVMEEHQRQSVGHPEGDCTVAIEAIKVPDGPAAAASFFSTATLSLVTV